MIDEKLIKDRKSVYGDNFECIAEAWSKLGRDFIPDETN